MENTEVKSQSVLVSIFRIGDAYFGIDTNNVQEVVKIGKITPVHNSHSFIVGVMNLRGKIVSVLDFGLKLDMEKIEENQDNRIYIVNWNDEQVGLLVDEVSDTVEVEETDLKSIPENVQGKQKRYFSNIFHFHGKLISMVNLDYVLRND
ncbi:MAG: purine-binding chemotaxis protein CheW [Candidatus Delongbacteria bacterium]|nr:purine-binding chemotaxis protein CheW [Candidatus Delongbacteria bacterium]MBN2833538.1 purine-binding chemotaxis protein CheW [Candidatus Delongbacteria bacterium]